MPITYVQSNANSGSSPTAAVTLTSAPIQGNLLVAFVGGTNTPTATNGWTALTGVTSTDSGKLFYKIAGSGELAAQDISTQTSGVWEATIAEFYGIKPVAPLSNQAAANVAVKTSPSITPASGLEVLLIGAAFTSSGNQTFSGYKFAGSTVGVDLRGSVKSGGNNGTSIALWSLTTTASGSPITSEAVASGSSNGGAFIASFEAAPIVLPSGVASTLAAGSPVVSSSATIFPGGVAGAASTGSPSVAVQNNAARVYWIEFATPLGGNATLSPQPIASELGVGNPSVGTSIHPESVVSSAAAGSPTLSLTIYPGGRASSLVAGSPSVTNVNDNRAARVHWLELAIISGQQVEVGGVAAGGGVGVPTVIQEDRAARVYWIELEIDLSDTAQTVSPGGVASSVATGTPNLSTGRGVLVYWAEVEVPGTADGPQTVSVPGLSGSLSAGAPTLSATRAVKVLWAEVEVPGTDGGLIILPVGVPPTGSVGTPALSNTRGVRVYWAEVEVPSTNVFAQIITIPPGVKAVDAIGAPTVTATRAVRVLWAEVEVPSTQAVTIQTTGVGGEIQEGTPDVSAGGVTIITFGVTSGEVGIPTVSLGAIPSQTIEVTGIAGSTVTGIAVLEVRPVVVSRGRRKGTRTLYGH